MKVKNVLLVVLNFICIGCNSQDFYRVDYSQEAKLEAGGKAKEIEIVTYSPTKKRTTEGEEIKGKEIYTFSNNGIL